MPALLNQVAITYAPVIAKNRKAAGTRIAVIPSGGTAPALGDLLASIIGLLPPSGQYYVAPLGVRLDQSVASLTTGSNVILEVPSTALRDDAAASCVMHLAANGVRLALRGYCDPVPSADTLACFEQLILNAVEERRRAERDSVPEALRRLPFLITGINQVAELDSVFRRGATASAGWPLDVQIDTPGREMSPSQAVVARLMSLVAQSADVRLIEDTLKKDPATGFRLLRFINSPAFGMPSQIRSFSHAIMLLGYAKMNRWLALLMATSSKDVNALPLMHASVRRGLFMEELVAGDEARADAMFIAGSFSLFDRIARTPFDRIFSLVSLSPVITDAILSRGGPCGRYLSIAEAVEQNDPALLVRLLSEAGLTLEQCNRALMSALARAELLDSEGFI